MIFSSVSAIDSQAALYACACIDVFSVDAGDVFMERSGDRWLHNHLPRRARRRLPLQRSPLVSHALSLAGSVPGRFFASLQLSLLDMNSDCVC